MADDSARLQKRSHKFEALDGWRGLSALLVVTFHYLLEATGYRFAGYIVVDFFLILSGFVLSHAYFSRELDFGGFVRNRIARMWPTHALIIVIMATALLVLKGEYDISKFVMKMTLTNNLGMGPEWPIYNWASWTVACEFWVNMIAAVLFVTLPILRRSLLALTVVCFSIAFACYATLFVYPGHLDAVLYDYGPGLNSGLIRCLGAFCLGLVTHRVFVLYGHLITPKLNIWAGLAITTFFLVLLMNPIENTRWDFLSVLALPLMVFYYAAADSPLTRFPAKLTFLGKISFSLYLLHWPALDATYLLYERLGIPATMAQPGNLIMVNVIAGSVSFVGAIFLQRYFEYPLYLKFRESHGARQRRLAAREAGSMRPAE